MAIIRFSHNRADVPANAVNLTGQHDGAGLGAYVDGKWQADAAPGPRALWTWHTHVGLCLRDYERNGYDDSDFHMVVWNPDKGEPEDICFASTRGWSYPAYNSFADATPEVRAAYEAYCQAQARRRRVLAKLAVRNLRNSLAREFGVKPSAIRRLEQAYGQLDARAVASRYNSNLSLEFGFVRKEQMIDRVIKLARQADSKRLKNEFRRSMARQVVAWLQDPAPRFDKPLSHKQAQYV